jgi:hypothetical protein
MGRAFQLTLSFALSATGADVPQRILSGVVNYDAAESLEFSSRGTRMSRDGAPRKEKTRQERRY